MKIHGKNLSAYFYVKEAESEKATHCYTTFYKRLIIEIIKISGCYALSERMNRWSTGDLRTVKLFYIVMVRSVF